MNYDYIIENHEEYGLKGMRPLFLENAEPAQALQATHDLLEHFLEPITSNAELQALGAMLYIRGEGNYFRKYTGSPILALASDLGSVLTYQYSFGEVTDPGQTRCLNDKVESWITQAIAQFYKDYENELNDLPQDKNFPHWLRSWLRIGYRRAKERYTLSPEILSFHFEQIEADFKKKLEWAEFGDIIRINLIRNLMDYKIHLINWYDPEHPDYVNIEEEEE